MNIKNYWKEKHEKTKYYEFSVKGYIQMKKDQETEALNRKVEIATKGAMYVVIGVLFYKEIVGATFIKTMVAGELIGEVFKLI